ncbi:MAG TPA: hypothetical protein VFE47_22595 [Tepidisphaeraceae bacterium]|nr:hypothetical protein [Tepidisphaeraceae bacterium]
MKKALFTPIVLGFALAPAFGADPIVTPPAAPPANVNVAQPQAQEPDRLIVPLRTLNVVQNARERRTPWQQSADEAVARINDPAIKANVTQQLSALAPQVAKALMHEPGENGIVTIAVYKDRGTGKEILAAVAFEGVGEGLNPSFYARVLANFPQVPGTDAKLAERLEYDPLASSFLCMFVNRGDLKADDITDAEMKKSLDLGIQQATQTTNSVPGGTAQPGQAALTQQQIDQIQQQENANAQAQEAAATEGPDYTTSYWDSNTPDFVPYYGVDGWIPWYTYVPAYGQAALISRPDFHHREHWIKHDEAVAAAHHEAAVEAHREQNSVIGSAHSPAQEAHRLILPSAGRNARRAAQPPVARPTSPAQIQGAHSPEQAVPRGEAPHAAPAAPAHEAPAGRK